MLDVPPDMTIADLKALILSDLSPPNPSTQLTIYHNGKRLGDASKSLDESGIKDGDMVVVHADPTSNNAPSSSSSAPRRRTPAPNNLAEGAGAGGRGQQHQQQQQMAPGLMEPDSEMIRLQVLGDPRLMEELRQSQPEMVAAVNDPVRFRHLFELLEQQKREAERAKRLEIARLDEDPFNPESQARIAELIRQEQVMENLQSAIEHNPEAFGKVIMLYIPVEVNGHPIKAFVDSGAQATIMSPSCAEACNIMRLIDSRYAGIARGIGTAKILGRVHSAQIRIGNLFLACSFTVMEGKNVDLLLGLDMLKRHQAKIDLERGVLVIGESVVEFLGEADIPKSEWERELGEPTVEGPGGARIGGRTGALVQAPIGSTPAATFSPPQPQSASTNPVMNQPYGGGGSAGGGGRLGSPRPQMQPPPLPGRGDTGGFNEEDIAQLMNLGFSRGDAVAALQATGGDVNMAASLLFQ